MFRDYGHLTCNLTLEVLKGCGFSCSDCAVDKGFTPTEIPEQDTQDLLALVDSLKAENFRGFEFTIGPTDLISSDNGFTTLDHPLVRGLAERYDSMAISLAMLSDRKLVELAAKIDEVIGAKRFRLIIPATLKNIKNPKYIAALKRRVEIIRDNLKVAEFYRIYLTVNVMYDNVADFNMDSDGAAQTADLGVWSTVEYTFGHSRRGFNNLMTAQEFKRDIQQFVEVLHGYVHTKLNRYLIPNIFDSIELVYRDGNLYYLPVIMEKFPIFDPAFIIPKPWNAEAIVNFKEQQYYTNLETFVEHPTCGDCCFLDNCARGDMHTVMRYLQHDGCLIQMKNRWDLNPQLVNGQPKCTNIHPSLRDKS